MSKKTTTNKHRASHTDTGVRLFFDIADARSHADGKAKIAEYRCVFGGPRRYVVGVSLAAIKKEVRGYKNLIVGGKLTLANGRKTKL